MRESLCKLLRYAKMLCMKLSEYLESKGRGAKAQLAADIGAYAPDVSSWVSGARPVPVYRCAAIERATGGAVTRKELRPDDWRLIWPELAEQEKTAAPANQARAAINFENQRK